MTGEVIVELYYHDSAAFADTLCFASERKDSEDRIAMVVMFNKFVDKH